MFVPRIIRESHSNAKCSHSWREGLTGQRRFRRRIKSGAAQAKAPDKNDVPTTWYATSKRTRISLWLAYWRLSLSGRML